MSMSGINVEPAKDIFLSLHKKSSSSTKTHNGYGDLVQILMIDEAAVVLDPTYKYPEDRYQTLPQESGKPARLDVDKLSLEDIRSKMSSSWNNECRYILVDLLQANKDQVFLIYWNPDGAPAKKKMVYAATFEALKLKCNGSLPIQASDLDDLMSGLEAKQARVCEGQK